MFLLLSVELQFYNNDKRAHTIMAGMQHSSFVKRRVVFSLLVVSLKAFVNNVAILKVHARNQSIDLDNLQNSNAF